MEIKIGSLVDGRYRITARIGHGGMAEVYEANDIISKVTVAIKLVREDIRNDKNIIRRFENEALIAASLNHPNIVKVYNHGTIQGIPYIANEYVKGQTLKDVLDFRGALPVREALEYMLQLTDALAYAHDRGIIHRDVKPENIFAMSDGTIKLGDFGIAQATGVDNNITKTNDIVGSVHYLAPEIAKGNPATSKSDIYSAGVLFYELLVGKPPFDKENAVNIAVAHIKEKFPSVKQAVPSCPKEVEKIIYKAVKKIPSERYQSAGEFYADLLMVKNNPNLFQDKRGFFSKLFGFK